MAYDKSVKWVNVNVTTQAERDAGLYVEAARPETSASAVMVRVVHQGRPLGRSVSVAFVRYAAENPAWLQSLASRLKVAAEAPAIIKVNKVNRFAKTEGTLTEAGATYLDEIGVPAGANLKEYGMAWLRRSADGRSIERGPGRMPTDGESVSDAVRMIEELAGE